MVDPASVVAVKGAWKVGLAIGLAASSGFLAGIGLGDPRGTTAPGIVFVSFIVKSPAPFLR